jgi:HEAT repeat protein
MHRGATLLVSLLALASLGFEWEGRLGRLERELETGDVARRREVVRLLGGYPAREVSDALLRALTDPDAAVRTEAAESAGRVGLREAVPRLLDWLDESDADVRTSAARALGRIGDPRTVAPLVRALGDPNAEVRRTAVRALASLGTPEAMVPLLGRLDDLDVEVRVEAAEALGRSRDPRAVVPLVGKARDDAPEMRIAVYTALGELGDARALPALVQGTHDTVLDAELAAIGALGKLGDEGAVTALVAGIDNPDPRRARASVAALAAIGSTEAIEAVTDALARQQTRALATETLLSRARSLARDDPDRHRELVMTLARSLERAGGRAQASAIGEVLGQVLAEREVPDVAPVIRRALEAGPGAPEDLLVALAESGSEEALVPILERLRASDDTLVAASLTALERYFDLHTPDGRAADPLLSALGRVPRNERVRVVRLLGRVRARRAVAELRPLLGHADPVLRQAAVAAIGAIGDPEGAPDLLALLDDRDARTRFEAARALGRAASRDTALALVDRLAAETPRDRHVVALALGAALARLRADGTLPPHVATRARRALGAAARGPDDELAARAIDALGQSADPANVETLEALLAHRHPPRRRAAALALGSIDDDGARAALRAARAGQDLRLRAAAAAALGSIGDASDVAPLLALARDARWPVDAAAAFGVARLARRGVISGDLPTRALCALARSRGPYVRANATVALAALGVGRCEGGPEPHAWLDPHHAPVVQVAAALFLASGRERGVVDADTARTTLDACAARALAPEVGATCASPSMPPLDDEADVYAWSADGETLLRDALVALRFSDGTALVTRTDENGHVRLTHAPRGALILDDPAVTPLEP